jgi:hypothetical protein
MRRSGFGASKSAATKTRRFRIGRCEALEISAMMECREDSADGSW